jgi:hypothetical protein
MAGKQAGKQTGRTRALKRMKNEVSLILGEFLQGLGGEVARMEVERKKQIAMQKLLLFSHKNAQQELNKAKHKKVKPLK